MSLQLTEQRHGDAVVISLAGRLLLGEGPEELTATIRRLLEAKVRRFVLDLSEVSYIDSAGLGSLVSVFSAVRSNGGRLVLAGLTKRITDLLQLTKLMTVFETFSTTQEALSSLSEVGS